VAATLRAPYDLRVEHYPYPAEVEPGAVLLRMLASGICGTDKHTYRGETEQYVGTDHASSTPFPIIPGHENVGVVVEIGSGGASAFDGSPLKIDDRVVPAPNRACGRCRYCTDDFPYYFCRNLENYGNSLSSSRAPHLFGGWSEYLYVLPRTPVFKVPPELPTDVAVLTELFAVTHSLDLVARMPRPGGYSPGDTVVIIGVGPVGLVHASKAALTGAGRVIAVDRFAARLDIAADLGATDCVVAGGDHGENGDTADSAGTGDEETIARVRELAGNDVDVVIDATGHPASFGVAMSLVRDGGTLVEVGAFVDLGPVPVNPAHILGRSITIMGVAGEDARIYDSTLRMLADRHHTVPFERAVTHRFPIERADEAMQTALGADGAMKVVIVPGA
jgi:L-iditol 2-dehydrogenase